MSIRQAEDVGAFLEEQQLPWNRLWDGGPVYAAPGRPGIELPGGMKITVLSPDPEQLTRLTRDWHQNRRRTTTSDVAQNDLTDDESGKPADDADVQDDAPSIFISFAREDRKWASRILESMPGTGLPGVILRDDDVTPGDSWADHIGAALAKASIAVVLASPSALASEFIMRIELPMILEAVNQGRLALTWILLEPCRWQDTPLATYQILHDVERPLSSLSQRDLTKELSKTVSSLARLSLGPQPARPRHTGSIDVETLANTPFVADRAVANNASIAFLAESGGKSVLVGSDASADVLAESIKTLLSRSGQRRLRVDAFVVPHNGSARNLSRELLELIDCERYLVASDGTKFKHPDRETIARILTYGRTTPDAPLTLVFNYRTPFTEVWANPELKARYRYEAIYPTGDGGIKVAI